jgi:hypothetical protein
MGTLGSTNSLANLDDGALPLSARKKRGELSRCTSQYWLQHMIVPWTGYFWPCAKPKKIRRWRFVMNIFTLVVVLCIFSIIAANSGDDTIYQSPAPEEENLFNAPQGPQIQVSRMQVTYLDLTPVNETHSLMKASVDTTCRLDSQLIFAPLRCYLMQYLSTCRPDVFRMLPLSCLASY